MNHRRPSPRRGRALLGSVLAMVLVTTGVALAYWQGAGAGAGSAATATPQSLQLTPAVPTATLAPGGQTGVTLTVNNPNRFEVALPALALDPASGTDGFAVDDAHGACGVAALRFTAPDAGTGGWTIPGRSGGTDGSLPITLTDSLAMTADAPDACQGAAFSVYLVSGG